MSLLLRQAVRQEERRREEEERIHGREILAQFPGVGPQFLDKLVEAGLYSPARIVRAGVGSLLALPNVGEKKASSLFEAAQAWVAEHATPAEAVDTGVEDAAEEPVPPAGASPGPDAMAHDPVPRASAE